MGNVILKDGDLANLTKLREIHSGFHITCDKVSFLWDIITVLLKVKNECNLKSLDSRPNVLVL